MATKPHQILIVDDDREIRDLLAQFLTQQGMNIITAQDGTEMQDAVKKQSFDLIILDVMLPGEDGLSLCRTLRAELKTPIIMLTAVTEETDRILGLELGADDYMTKPFNPRELLARIRAVLRRSQAEETQILRATTNLYRFADWRLDKAARQLLSPDDVEISLTAGEYDLLLALIENAQHVLSRDQLLDITRNRAAGPFDRSIDVQISRLRQKIEADPKKPIIIKTVRGGGYVLTTPVTVEKQT